MGGLNGFPETPFCINAPVISNLKWVEDIGDVDCGEIVVVPRSRDTRRLVKYWNSPQESYQADNYVVKFVKTYHFDYKFWQWFTKKYSFSCNSTSQRQLFLKYIGLLWYQTLGYQITTGHWFTWIIKYNSSEFMTDCT